MCCDCCMFCFGCLALAKAVILWFRGCLQTTMFLGGWHLLSHLKPPRQYPYFWHLKTELLVQVKPLFTCPQLRKVIYLPLFCDTFGGALVSFPELAPLARVKYWAIIQGDQWYWSHLQFHGITFAPSFGNHPTSHILVLQHFLMSMFCRLQKPVGGGVLWTYHSRAGQCDGFSFFCSSLFTPARSKTCHWDSLMCTKKKSLTLPETNIAPENGWLEY